MPIGYLRTRRSNRSENSPTHITRMEPRDEFTSLSHISPVLTVSRLSAALSDWFQEPVSFTHWEYVGDTGKGDSYLSDVIRIRIHGRNNEGRTEHVQVILKNIPKNICRRLTYRSHEFFRNEIQFYEKVLPELLKFQSEKKLTDPFAGYAKLFVAHSDGLHDVICLEDACVHNYGSAVRQEGIDIEHFRTALKTIAQFHAISFAFRDQKPNKFDEIRKEIFETYYDDRLFDWYEKFWKRICWIIVDAVEKEYPESVYAERIKRFAVPETYQRMIAAAKKHDKGVISHGDSWTNNFLFKYESSKVVAVKLIDFQLTRCASPVLDISFFIYACTTQELREKHYDEMLQYYHNILSAQIEEMGSDPNKLYPFDTFLEEIKMYSYFGLAFSFESMPFIILSPEDALNMNGFEGSEKRNIDDFWQVQPYKTRAGRLRAAGCVVHAVDRGYI